jgi:hypothetical protein
MPACVRVHSLKLSEIFFKILLGVFFIWDAGEIVFHNIWSGFHESGYLVYIFFSKRPHMAKNGSGK